MKSLPAPGLAPGDTHTLRAEIIGDEIVAWIDKSIAWRGFLPDAARDLTGPVGIRSDNMQFDLVAFDAPAGDASVPAPKCVTEDGDVTNDGGNDHPTE